LSDIKYQIQNLIIFPKEVKVREYVDISFKFSLSFDLPKDSMLCIRMRGGRNNKNDWYYLQTYDPNTYGLRHSN
jgi:hypothetical protein